MPLHFAAACAILYRRQTPEVHVPDEQPDEHRPPYLSFTTLHGFLERIGAGPIPPRIDRSAMDSYSGGTQGMILSALRAMDLIDADGNVKPALVDAARHDDARKAAFASFARRVYPVQLALAERNGTAQMLHESFADTGYSGSTLRKAVVFYLALIDYTGLPNSPHFRPPKQQGPRRRRVAETLPPSAVDRFLIPTTQEAPEPAAPKGDTTIIKIGTLATITVTVDAQWLRLPVETLTGIRTAVADLEALATGLPAGDDHRPDGEDK